jgi:hypothetical protein
MTTGTGQCTNDGRSIQARVVSVLLLWHCLDVVKLYALISSTSLWKRVVTGVHQPTSFQTTNIGRQTTIEHTHLPSPELHRHVAMTRTCVPSTASSHPYDEGTNPGSRCLHHPQLQLRHKADERNSL